MPRPRRFRPNIPFLCAVGVFVLAIVAYIGLGVLWATLSPRQIGVPSGWTLPLLARSLDAVSAVWFFAVGASIGSFLNVVAYRLPRGKTLLGNSACPFCCTPISAVDNIPVFAWLRLRGRCRTCRLPISIEYPLIELMVGLVFLVVYFTEFAVAGSNLPGTGLRPVGSGLVWMSVTPLLATRTLLYLFTLSGLIAAALIVVRRAETPLTLFGWVLLTIVAGGLIKPAAVVVPWWPIDGGHGATRVDALLTMGLGWLAGLMAAALTLPALQRATSQVAWYGTLACMGAIVGWQWVAVATACILLVTLCAVLLRAGRGGRQLRRPLSRWSWLDTSAGSFGTVADPVVWAWLGLLLFRANWKSLDGMLGGLQSQAAWVMVAVCGLAAVVAAWLVGCAAQALGSTSLEISPAQVITAQAITAQDAASGEEGQGSQEGAVLAPPPPHSPQ